MRKSTSIWSKPKGPATPWYVEGWNCEGCPYRERARGFAPPEDPAVVYTRRCKVCGTSSSDDCDCWTPIPEPSPSARCGRGATLMFVGEGLGRWEMENGGPFSGKAGTMFGQCLSVGAILRSDHVVTNAIKCRSIQWVYCAYCDEGELPQSQLCPECNGAGEIPRINPRTGDYFNATPDWKMVQECGRRYLDKEMAEFKGDLPVPMGDVALYATTGMRGITKLRGSVLEGRICRDCGGDVLDHDGEIPF